MNQINCIIKTISFKCLSICWIQLDLCTQSLKPRRLITLLLRSHSSEKVELASNTLGAQNIFEDLVRLMQKIHISSSDHLTIGSCCFHSRVGKLSTKRHFLCIPSGIFCLFSVTYCTDMISKDFRDLFLKKIYHSRISTKIGETGFIDRPAGNKLRITGYR